MTMDDELKTFVRMVVLEADAEHKKNCPAVALEQRVRVIEIRFAALLGWMCGSGLMGGAVGAGLFKMLS